MMLLLNMKSMDDIGGIMYSSIDADLWGCITWAP
jgi:hypothetical protein